ncbi:MAG: hypothetical protein RL095_3938 [Verrucomicrobiota bacterium]|jgi:GTP cyclohydrolase II
MNLESKCRDSLQQLQEGRCLRLVNGDRRQLVVASATAGAEGLKQILDHCSTLELVADALAWPGPVPAVLKCEASVAGLLVAFADLAAGRMPSGPDLIPLRLVDGRDLLKNDSSEARQLELLSRLEIGGSFILSGIERGEADGVLSVTADEVRRWRVYNPHLIALTGVTRVSLLQGEFDLHSFYSEVDRRYHWAFVATGPAKGEGEPALVRIESECLTGHVFGSLLCDCGDQLAQGLAAVAAAGRGALIYLRQEGRGIGLKAKLQAYYLQQVHGLDTVDANLAVGMPEDARDYLIGAQILELLGMRRIQLLSNNPAKIEGLEEYGIEIAGRRPHVIPPSDLNRRYLEVKRDRMGHQF